MLQPCCTYVLQCDRDETKCWEREEGAGVLDGIQYCVNDSFKKQSASNDMPENIKLTPEHDSGKAVESAPPTVEQQRPSLVLRGVVEQHVREVAQAHFTAQH
ncbi:unnamed protein product [Timema podura]|uniref:Uncharacterized protein n=1 Tax=Timema podura TaxID=61482 RepID=A0ABN7PBC0_TIMPD|nr:unnamed protein product [Timema podura]